MRQRGKKGFTMIEIVAAMVIITTIAVGILGASTYSRRAVRTAQQKMVAVQLVDKKMAEIKSDNGQSLEPDDYPQLVAVSELKNGGMITTVTELLSNPRLKEVAMTIGWDYLWTADAENCCTSAPPYTCDGCDKQETVRSVFFSE